MPVVNAELISRGLYEISTLLPREGNLQTRGVDHRALETLAVAATCIFGVGGFIVWAMRQK
ncbi:uncharacterized protein BCR38DRAFT_417298 [Pseudomassariella vexata]|uniref:Uncharacterized protein n=1 Tax=Pseudomassariella vexata TaxID=1141098 RepID=A0A1Y2EJT2_9PEZI|nr:uncharacterized protein BCR38DRAFT_417298 [Pseudomassariella vexata]ORY71536.1 hypothetical protein BCR38DRAFT_417298 [Pseudomassariella vexata]